MTKRVATSIAIATAMICSVLAPSQAAAATEFGNTCTGDEAVGMPYVLASLAAPASGVPVAAPTSGVITKVRAQVALPLPLSLPEEVKLLRPAGGGNFTVTAQTAIQAGFGQTVADTRMQVLPGEVLAMHGLPFKYEGTNFPGYEFYCDTPGGILGVHEGDIALGSTGLLSEEPEAGVPLVATIEPDADHDGFGDETQDGCPRSAAVQAECPVVVLDSYVLPSRSKAVVLVSSSTGAPVTVSGTAKLPKASKKAGASVKSKLKAVTKNVTPGKLNRFTLKFPAALKAAIKALPAGRSITVKLQATATDAAGSKTTDRAQLKVKG